MAEYTLWPSILPDEEEFVDDSYSAEELDRMDGNELQSLAAEHPTDARKERTVKIAILGGGSAYAPGLVAAFAERAAAFDGAELFLMDVAAAELEIIERLARRLLEGTTLSVRASTDRLAALDGATHVLTTFREGGLDARERDETVPLAHGVVGQETIGPGGFFFATRTLPVIRAVTEEMRTWAPEALLVNYANPTQIVAEAVQRHTDVPVVAICDQADDDRTHIAAALDLAPHEVELEAYGVNHATWSSHVRIEGEDGVARLVIDGAEAARFTNTVIEYLEQPRLLLLE